MAHRVSKRVFGQLVERAIEELPAEFVEFLDEVPIEVRDNPTPAQLDSVGIGAGSLLLGLYQGRPLTQRSVEDSGRMPDTIFIFQQPLETISRDEDDLVRQVRKTVLHEIGHHFGMSEKDLDDLGYG